MISYDRGRWVFTWPAAAAGDSLGIMVDGKIVQGTVNGVVVEWYYHDDRGNTWEGEK